MAGQLSPIEEFYELHKEDFHGSFRDFDGIVRGPFRFLKRQMAEGTMEPYRLQHFATFFIPKTRLYYSKIHVQRKYDEGLLGTEKYNQKMTMYERYKEEDHY